MQDTTTAWLQYEKGKEYNRKLNLYENVDKCERIFAGMQWEGVKSNGLPTPVFNVHKRIGNYFISAILSQAVKMQFTPENVPEDSQDPKDIFAKMAAEIVNDQCDRLWERLKMDSHMRHALRDAFLSGDMVGHIPWNQDVITAEAIEGITPQGDIDFELVDNVSVMFGNPNDYRVQTQPYIIIAFRALVSALRTEARRNKVPEEEVLRIVADNDYREQSGDRGKIELDASGSEDGGKTTALIKFWKDPETKSIKWSKSTKGVVIIKEQDYKQSLYPVAWASWDYRKNSYHGQAVGLELIPNQIFINKMFAMVMLNLMNVAFPKAVYNKGLIGDNWTNQVGQAIGVESAEDINKVAAYLQPGNMSNQVMQVIDAAINYTKDLVGASDAALGSIKPDNHSAIVAVQQAAMIPLETIKQNLYQWVEDIGNIWLDFMGSKYGVRTVIYKGQRMQFDFNVLKELKLQLKIDVGPSSYWSEITAAQTLDNLLQAEKINFIQYLERMPDGYIPQKQELIDEVKKQMADAANKEPEKKPPSVTISFKDLPMMGKIQLAAQLGIELKPEDFFMEQDIDDAVTQNREQSKAELAAQGQQPPQGGGTD